VLVAINAQAMLDSVIDGYRKERLSSTARAAALYAVCLLALIVSTRSSIKLHTTFRLRSTRVHDEPLEQSSTPHVALVTLADARFLNCSLQLIRGARAYGWRQPVFLLTVGTGLHDSADGREATDELGVELVRTSGTLDAWVGNMKVPRRYHYRRMSAAKFRKMDIFFNPLFRTFDRIIYMDPDGLIASSLEPLALMTLPPDSVLGMRQNDASVGKPSLWRGEVAPDALLPAQRERLGALFPDHALVGASCWFMVEMGRLPPPRALLRTVRQLICEFKGGFRLNDQTLLNLLFYGRITLVPWCSGSEVAASVAESGGGAALRRYCDAHMRAQRWADGGLRFIYRHFSPAEKAECVGAPETTWDDAAPVDEGAGDVRNASIEVECAAEGRYDGSLWQ
jgi:hypothetical protein